LEAALRTLSAQSSLARFTARIREAELSPDAWPEMMASLTEAVGAGGAACILFNKKSSSPDWVCFSGLSAAFETRYVHHFASLDPFSPLLNVSPGWTKLSECLPQAALAKSEWYNDFVLACGVRDIVGTRLIDAPSHYAVIGFHQRLGRYFGSETTPILDQVTAPLRTATLRQVERLFDPAHDDPATEPTAGRARYFFHLGNGREYPDETGNEFATREDAIAYASILVAELCQDRDWYGFEVSVKDEAGEIVARKPVRI
jgi:hypothetical protein